MTVDFQRLPHSGIQSLVPYKPGKSIDELKKEKGLIDIIKLASNENPLGCSVLALKSIRNSLSANVANYPSVLNHPLMDKLSKHLKIAPEQLFLSNGSDCIFGLLMQCFALHLNKHLLTHEFAFSTYAVQAHALQIPVHTVPINQNWEVDVDKIITACTKQTAMICIANPNNPTGLLINPKKIIHILENIPPSTLLVLDEAYYEYASDQLDENSIDWLVHYPNLIITRTFSKIYGMAGLRLGYAIAHPDIIDTLRRVQLPFSVNQIALNAACEALDDYPFIINSLKVNKEGMKQCVDAFNSLKIETLPSSGNFLCFNIKEDGLSLYNYLLERGIIIRPLHPYNMHNYLRVTIGTSVQNQRFFDELAHYQQLKG